MRTDWKPKLSQCAGFTVKDDVGYSLFAFEANFNEKDPIIAVHIVPYPTVVLLLLLIVDLFVSRFLSINLFAYNILYAAYSIP